MMKPSSQNWTLVTRNAAFTSFNRKPNKWVTHLSRRMLNLPSSLRGEFLFGCFALVHPEFPQIRSSERTGNGVCCQQVATNVRQTASAVSRSRPTYGKRRLLSAGRDQRTGNGVCCQQVATNVRETASAVSRSRPTYGKRRLLSAGRDQRTGNGVCRQQVASNGKQKRLLSTA